MTGTLRVMNASAMQMFEMPLMHVRQAQVDLSALAAGEYFLVAQSANGTQQVVSKVIRN
jgi:hypothetical protein